MESKSTYQDLKQEIALLEQQLRKKKQEAAKIAGIRTSKESLDPFQQQLLEAEKKIGEYFESFDRDSISGRLGVEDDRFLLLRSSSLSYDFFKSLLTLLDDNTGESSYDIDYGLLYDIANIIGRNDAELVSNQLKRSTPLEKLTAGLANFSFIGLAKVEILPGSNPTADNDFLLKYRCHNSFEAEAWVSKNGCADTAVCAMAAGYSSGWCSYSYGVELTAAEVTCSARKEEENCDFVMAPPTRINEYLGKEKREGKSLPRFFERTFYKSKLAENELLMRSAEEFSKVGIIDVNFIEDKAVWTREVDKMFEIQPDNKDDLYSTFLSRLDDRSKEVLQCEIDNLMLNGDGFEIKTVLHFSDRENKFVVMAFSALRDIENRVVGMKGLVQDISPQMIEGRELDYFFNMSADLLCIANHEGYFVKLSPGWSELLGYTEEELKSKPYVEFVHPDDRKMTSNEKLKIEKTKSVSLFENRYITKSGEVVRLSWHTRADDFTNFIYSTARNVTEEREKEEQLISSLSEKKLLLREIHHRVKNNLQVISSLLSLQSGMKNSDARLEQLYRDSQNRINSMAAIHEMFYKSESLDRMDFPVYVKKLIIDLIYSLKGKESMIELDFHSEEVQFDLDTAIPLGLIINEIITNALKHAFNGRNSGVITVSFDTSDEDYVLLTIGDNGSGTPEQKDPLTLKNETLGMLLINSLIDQIGASIHFLKNKQGVNYEIQLPVN